MLLIWSVILFHVIFANEHKSDAKSKTLIFDRFGNSNAKKWNDSSSNSSTDPFDTIDEEAKWLGCGRAPLMCPPSRYRSYDGSCNNLENPTLGVTHSRFRRLLPPLYADGISSMVLAKSGKPLPDGRSISLLIYPDVYVEDPNLTLLAMHFGQILSHDMSFVARSAIFATTRLRLNCCQNGLPINPNNRSKRCNPILSPPNVHDRAYMEEGIMCRNFMRTVTDRDRDCIKGNHPVEQLSQSNHYLDVSFIYGNDISTNRKLREYSGGRLRVDIRDKRHWLPRAPNASDACAIRTPNEPCYFTGDDRVNQNAQNALMHVIFLREHNRIADVLAKMNPHWDDERVFQEARRILIAEYQYITYYEWLPLFLGYQHCLRNKLIYDTDGYVNDYSSDIDATTSNEHAGAAFRYFHTFIAGNLSVVNEARQVYDTLRLSDWTVRPSIIERGKYFDGLARGLATQAELKADIYHDTEIKDFLFRLATIGSQFGIDLKASDVQRSRDHGLRSYNDYREYVGFSKAHKFDDFLDIISKKNVLKLKKLYEHPDDVDLTVGGSLEELVPGALAGPTFLHILTEQFYHSRAGDRFWFENGSTHIAFTPDQLRQIKKASIAKIFCDNGDNIKHMQVRAFEKLSRNNALVPCEKITSMDLSKWKENYNFHYNHE